MASMQDLIQEQFGPVVLRVIEEVLDTMIGLAEDGMTMLCVTHEMGFARKVANRVIFMDEGKIVEDRNKDDFFNNPQSDRARDFLAKILH